MDHHHVQKTWGSEEWVVNNDLYCGKVLRFSGSGGTSLHFHIDKHETMYCLAGLFTIDLVDPETAEEYFVCLAPGDSVVIPPGQVHRICGAMEENVLIEFSTHHEDADSYRVKR